jgi:hypothetical protein
MSPLTQNTPPSIFLWNTPTGSCVLVESVLIKPSCGNSTRLNQSQDAMILAHHHLPGWNLQGKYMGAVDQAH